MAERVDRLERALCPHAIVVQLRVVRLWGDAQLTATFGRIEARVVIASPCNIAQPGRVMNQWIVVLAPAEN